MKVARWLVIVAVSFMTLVASLDYLRDIVTTSSFAFLPTVGIILMIVIIVALLKKTKVWMITAMLSTLVLLGANIEMTMEYVKTHSIALTIIITTLVYLGVVFKNRQFMQQ